MTRLGCYDENYEDNEDDSVDGGGKGSGIARPHVLSVNGAEDALSELGALRAYVVALDACEA